MTAEDRTANSAPCRSAPAATAPANRFLPGVPGADVKRLIDAAPGNEIAGGKFDSPESSAQIDGGGVESVDGLVQHRRQGAVTGIKFSRLNDQTLRDIGVDAPVAALIGIGQVERRTGARKPVW